MKLSPRQVVVGAIAALLVLAGASQAALAEPAVTNARIGTIDGATRLVLDLSEPLSGRLFTMSDPARLVIDLPSLEWKLAAETLGVEEGIATRLRFGQFKPEVSRVVLDLHEPVTVRQVVEEPAGDGRTLLVIDMVPVAPGNFRQETHDIAPPAETPATRARQAVSQAETLPEPPAPAPPRPKALAAPKEVERIVVAVDPGHGGNDPGAISDDGQYEKNITLPAALDLSKLLEATGHYKVVMTRTIDVYVTLADRVEIARKAGARLFVSLHADRHPNDSVRGLSVYTLSEKASDAETQSLAERENRSDVIAGVDLGDTYDEELARILISLVQQSTMNCSASFATDVVDELAPRTLLLKRTHRFAGFRVLKSPDVPSVLIEMGYLSNPKDAALLLSPPYRHKLMAALAKAIDRYFDGQAC